MDSFRAQVRDALLHLYDQAYLECHPLAEQLIDPSSGSAATRAQVLRRILKNTIEELRPQIGDPVANPEWRGYLALNYRYVRGMAPLEVQDELGISRRQLQREERKAIDAIAAILWKQRHQDLGASAERPENSLDNIDLVRRELEHWEVNRQLCTARGLVEHIEWLLRPVASEHGVSLAVDVPSDLPQVFVDPTLTTQALLKVCRLVIERSVGGDICLAAEAAQATLALTLSGTGAPIDEGDDEWTIARLLMDQQGGDAVLTRGEDDRSTVSIRLPLAAVQRVMVIDDVEAVHRLFERYLSPLNYEVFGVADGRGALDAAARIRPDIIVLDVMIPEIDGWHILRALKERELTARIPVVICSVLDEPDIALGSGASAFIKKPVRREELLAVLERVRASRGTAGAGRQASV